jgi:hypothetical protein
MPAPLITASDLAAALPDVPPASLAGLPARVTAAVERYCGRPLALASRDEEHTPGTTRLVRLKGRPVAPGLRVLTDLSTVLSVRRASGPWRATIALTLSGDPAMPSGLALATEAGTTTLPFAPTSGPALATVASSSPTAINAVSGWSATVAPGMGGCPVAEVRPVRGALDALARPASLEAYASALGDYELEPRAGKLTLRQIRPDPYAYPNRTFGQVGSSALVRVLYSAGYNGDPDAGPITVPGDLAEACVLVAKAILDTRSVSGVLASESLGNTSYTVGTPTPIPPGARTLLEPYVDRRPC